jgi:hypothetical protein
MQVTMSIRHDHNGRQIIQTLMAAGASAVLLDYAWRTRASDALAVGQVWIFDGKGCEIEGAGGHVLPWIGRYFEGAPRMRGDAWREKDEYTAMRLEDAIRAWSQALLNKFHAKTLSRSNHSGHGRAGWRLPKVPDSVRDISAYGSTLEMLNDECFTAHDECDGESARKVVCIPISMTGVIAKPFTKQTINRDLVTVK